MPGGQYVSNRDSMSDQILNSTYLMEVVLLVELALNLSINGHAHQERILLANSARIVCLILPKHVLKGANRLSRVLHLLLDRVLEVSRKVLDLLDLLLKITAQPGQGQDDVFLNLLGLVRLDNSILVVGAKELESVVDAGALEEVRRG